LPSHPGAFEQPHRSLRRGRKLVLVGSIVGTRNDLREVFELHVAGRTRVIRETRPLDQVNEAIADVEAGRVAARIVLEP
jgi:alcohol dehydrogenase, propanol-preferring